MKTKMMHHEVSGYLGLNNIIADFLILKVIKL